MRPEDRGDRSDRDAGEGSTRSSLHRVILAFFVALALAATVVAAVLHAVSPPPAPARIGAGAPVSRPLTTRLMLVIVDGLRYDIATNAELMPHFSFAMREHPSGEMWAGKVSMTSSAILAIGTGQPGGLEQIIRNVDARPPPFNSWIENAAVSGLRIGLVGDGGWFDIYGKHLWKSRLDPPGVAIDVDFNPETFRGSRELIGLSPDVLILHFGTPDHQGHAYGIRSRRYSEHILRFDADLAALLGELPPAWTVIVTSDHGAADSGTHGTDVPIQRRGPVYAYGPGIRPGSKLDDGADQLDLAATLPVLLGVAPPAHGLGHVLVPILDTPAPEAARIACESADRVLSYGEAAVGGDAIRPARGEYAGCIPSAAPAARSTAAKLAVRAAALGVSRVTGLASPSTRLWLAGIFLLGIVLMGLLVPDVPTGAQLVGFLVLALTVLLVFGVERLPSVWPNVVRVGLFVGCNTALLALILSPSETAAWLERHPLITFGLAPAAVVVSYPANAPAEAYAVTAALAVLYLGYGAFRPGLGRFFRGYHAVVPGLDRVALALALLVLFPTAIRMNGTYSELLSDGPLRSVVIVALAAGALAWLARGLRGPSWAPPLVALVGVVAISIRPALGPFAGRLLWLGFAALFAALASRGDFGWALVAGAIAVLWVSRAFEAVPLLACLVAATVIGRAILLHGARRDGESAFVFRRTNELLLVSLHFALAYLLRVGVQDGLELGGMYWGAGGFNDSQVSPYLVGAALVFKYAMGVVLVGLGLHPAWASRSVGTSRPLEFGARVCAAGLALRSLSLAAMFLLAGNSYWTALRVMGDLPTALAMTLGALVLVVVTRARLSTRAVTLATAP